ncbi:protein asteroid homolog 1 [Triplophysa dalaica]|uniref:protein asteroid homolog 1 n=1 Tax=Triplophysa dalaica TaxID=1582913 RepID=UPI0024DFCBE7|nr:protein asteroid homolog 1 [Triplophysa dalaica]
MGVRGLTSYVEGNHNFFTDMRLRDCRLVIDGCSLYFRLYFNSGLDQAMGGDYDMFAMLVQQFFAALAECNVHPFVVLDGGMDHMDKKFKTLQERTQNKIREAHSLSRGSNGSVLPLLSRVVFIQVLSQLGVPLVQCMTEADFEIASLAKHWHCPVLSNDSDFYIFDLRGGYLPLSFFEWNNVSGKTTERYIPARHFTVNRFCSHFNRLKKQLLPLFAVVAGNDYTPDKITEAFFIRAEFPTGRMSGRGSGPRLEGFLLWLSRFTTPVDAMEEVLEILGGQQKGNIRTQLSNGIQDYQLPQTSSLAQYFTSPQPALPNTQGLSRSAVLASQPEWLLRAVALGKLPSLVLDVLVLQKVLLIAQVENSQLPSSHLSSLSIRKTIYGLLLDKSRHNGQRQQTITQRGRGRGGDDPNRQSQSRGQQNDIHYVEEYDRQDLNLKKNTVEVHLPSVPQLNLTMLDKVPKHVRLQVLLGTLGVMDHVLQPVPLHLSLPVCVMYFWRNNAKPKPNLPLLQAMLLGLVYGELSWRMVHPDDPLYGSKSAATVCQQLSLLRVNPGQRRGLDLGVAHLLCQWQSCMLVGLYLNQLLCFPLPEPQSAWVFSGTLLHGLAAAIKGGQRPETLLAGDSFAQQLYSILLQAIVGPASLVTPSNSKGGGQKQAQQRGRGNGERGGPRGGRGGASGGRGGASGGIGGPSGGRGGPSGGRGEPNGGRGGANGGRRRGSGQRGRGRGMIYADNDFGNRFSHLTFEDDCQGAWA